MIKTIHKSGTKQSAPTDVSTADSASAANLSGEHGCDAVPPASEHPAGVCEEAIRMLAHHKWEAAGCPEGDGVDFWLAAEQELNAQRLGASPPQE